MLYKYIFILLIVQVFTTVQETDIEVAYFKMSGGREPYNKVDNVRIMSFQEDIDGDGHREIFLTRNNFRSGKQGHVWTLFAATPSGSYRLLGEDTFSHKVFAVRPWSKDNTTQGYYTFGPGGASKGMLFFHAIQNGELKMLEKRKISPNSADKAEFDELFGARLTGLAPPIELKETDISMVESRAKADALTSASKSPPRFEENKTEPKNAPPLASEPNSRSLLPSDGLRWLLGSLLLCILAVLLLLRMKRGKR